MHILDHRGNRPVGYSCDLDWVHGKGSQFDYHSEVFDFGDVERTLFQFEIEVKFLHLLKDSFCSFFVIFVIVGVDEEVIYVDDKPSFCNHIPERVRHELLESGGRVGHAEEHNSGFIESPVGNESGFPLVSLLDSDVVISPSYIKLGEDLGIFEFVDEV